MLRAFNVSGPTGLGLSLIPSRIPNKENACPARIEREQLNQKMVVISQLTRPRDSD